MGTTTTLVSTFNELIYRFTLYMGGVRFHDWKHIHRTPPIDKRKFRIQHRYEVEFLIYRQACDDHVLLRGKLTDEHYDSYMVKAIFSGDFPANIEHLNRRTLYFNGKINRFAGPEKWTINTLVELYIDYLSKRIALAENTL